MTVCVSIAQFPVHGAFFLADDHEAHGGLRRLLRLFRPALRDCGVLDGALPADGSFVLLSGAPWWSRLESLLARGVPAERIVLFVPPAGDYCGYLDFFAPLMEGVRSTGGGFVVGWEALHARLRQNRAAAIGKMGRMLLEPDRCFSARPPRGEEWRAVERVEASMEPEQARSYRANWDMGPLEWVRRFVERAFNHVQYFDHVRLAEDAVVVNCGLATGWEMPMLLACLNRGGKVYCIDPTGERYLASEPKAVIDGHRDQVVVVEEALADFEGRVGGEIKGDMAFIGTGGGDADGFSCTTLDRLVDRFGIDRIDLIKIDIEGSEAAALKGMSESIRRFRPQLAISVYHRPEDLWELPDFVLGLVDGYTTFVESYCYNRSETIAYLIPNERLAQSPSWGIPGVAASPIRLEVEGERGDRLAWVGKWLMGRRG